MDKKKKIGLGCCVLIVLVIILFAATSDKSTNTASGTQLNINYTGSWSGAYMNGSSSQSIDGTGPETINISSDAVTVSANAQKKDSSSDEMVISIIKNGKTVSTSNTTAEYGMVSVVN